DGINRRVPIQMQPELPSGSLTLETRPTRRKATVSEQLDQVFGQLVHRSWERYNEQLRTREIDDLLVGAVITAGVAQDYSLIDLTSDGNSHYLRFQHRQNKHRLMFQLAHQTGTVTAAKTLGQYAAVTIAYGEYVQDARTVWQALKTEVK